MNADKASEASQRAAQAAKGNRWLGGKGWSMSSCALLASSPCPL